LNREEIEKIQNDMRDQTRVAIQEATQAPDSDPAELLASVFRQVNS
jgi:TPP-dependent pyruvate/acetoin dehydrogenase alpha subunit